MAVKQQRPAIRIAGLFHWYRMHGSRNAAAGKA
jgi:hypothetical protein